MRSLGQSSRRSVAISSRKAQPALKIAAIAIGALVRERRQEFVQQIAVHNMQLDKVETELEGAASRDDKAAVTSRMSSSVISRKTGQPASNSIAEGAIVSQAPVPGASGRPPSQGS
jgi:hypothetical protein